VLTPQTAYVPRAQGNGPRGHKQQPSCSGQEMADRYGLVHLGVSTRKHPAGDLEDRGAVGAGKERRAAVRLCHRHTLVEWARQAARQLESQKRMLGSPRWLWVQRLSWRAPATQIEEAPCSPGATWGWRTMLRHFVSISSMKRARIQENPTPRLIVVDGQDKLWRRPSVILRQSDTT